MTVLQAEPSEARGYGKHVGRTRAGLSCDMLCTGGHRVAVRYGCKGAENAVHQYSGAPTATGPTEFAIIQGKQ